MFVKMRARAFDEVAVLHAGRTRGFAGAATQTFIQMRNQSWCRFGAAFGEGAHQVNSSARRIGFQTFFGVSWARGKTQAAMNAIHQALMVEMNADFFRRLVFQRGFKWNDGGGFKFGHYIAV